MSLLTFVVAIIVGMLVLLLLGRWIGRVRFSLCNAFWCSAIGHLVPAIPGLILGYFLHDHLLAAFIIGIAITWLFQTVLFQVAARTQNETLAGWRAAILALIVIIADFLIASPIVELVQRASVNGANG